MLSICQEVQSLSNRTAENLYNQLHLHLVLAVLNMLPGEFVASPDALLMLQIIQSLKASKDQNS